MEANAHSVRISEESYVAAKGMAAEDRRSLTKTIDIAIGEMKRRRDEKGGDETVRE